MATMATMASNPRAGGGDGRRDRKAAAAARIVALSTAVVVAVGSLRIGAAAESQPGMLAVDEGRCVHTSIAGIPGEGCGPASYALIPVVAPTVDAFNCVYASPEGTPGEGCEVDQRADGKP